MTEKFFHKKECLLLQDILEITGAELLDAGDLALRITDVVSIEGTHPKGISFFQDKRMLAQFKSNNRGACFIEKRFADAARGKDNILVVESPEVAFTKVARALYPDPYLKTSSEESMVSSKASIGKGVEISPGAVISEGAEIGEGTYIGANAFIGPHVRIGKYCRIHAGVSIVCAVVGDHCVIHQNAAIGQAGFGFVPTAEGMLDIPQIGCVEIHDHVHIGACATIDRGGLGNTVIGAQTRIDNLVQIAHNVKIGRGCVIVAQTGIAGSTVLGDYSMLGGQVGLADHITLGKGVRVAAQGGVMKNLEDGAVVGGSPCVPIKQWHRSNLVLAKLAKEGKK